MIKGAPDPLPRPELVIEEEEYEPELPPLDAGDWDFELEDDAKELEDAQMNPAEAEEEEEGGDDEEGLPPLPVKTLWFMVERPDPTSTPLCGDGRRVLAMCG